MAVDHHGNSRSLTVEVTHSSVCAHAAAVLLWPHLGPIDGAECPSWPATFLNASRSTLSSALSHDPVNFSIVGLIKEYLIRVMRFSLKVAKRTRKFSFGDASRAHATYLLVHRRRD